MPTFKEYMQELAPGWLADPHGLLWLYALGDLKDELGIRATQAVEARFPRFAPADALPLIGIERQLPRAPGESLTTYAGRLEGAWDTWPNAGTALGMLQAFRTAGYPNTRLFTVGSPLSKGFQYELDGDGEPVATECQLDAFSTRITRDFWSEFEIHFFPPYPSAWVGTPRPALPQSFTNFTGAWGYKVTAIGGDNLPVDLAVKILSVTGTATGYTYKVSLDGGTTFSTATYTAPGAGVAVGVDALAGISGDFPGKTPTGLTFEFFGIPPEVDDMVFSLMVAGGMERAESGFTNTGKAWLEGKPLVPNVEVVVDVTSTPAAFSDVPGTGVIQISLAVSDGGANTYSTGPFNLPASRLSLDSLAGEVTGGTHFLTGLSLTGWGLWTDGDASTLSAGVAAPTTTLYPPASDSDEVGLFKRLVLKWKAGEDTLARLVFHESGQLWDFPRRAWDDWASDLESWDQVEQNAEAQYVYITST